MALKLGRESTLFTLPSVNNQMIAPGRGVVKPRVPVELRQYTLRQDRAASVPASILKQGAKPKKGTDTGNRVGDAGRDEIRAFPLEWQGQTSPQWLLSEFLSIRHFMDFPLLPPKSNKGRGPCTQISSDNQAASCCPGLGTRCPVCSLSDQEHSLCVISVVLDLSRITEVITMMESHPGI